MGVFLGTEGSASDWPRPLHRVRGVARWIHLRPVCAAVPDGYSPEVASHCGKDAQRIEITSTLILI